MAQRGVTLDRQGARIEIAMAKLGHAKQGSLASALGVEPSTITNWLAGRPISRAPLTKLLGLLEIEYEHFCDLPLGALAQHLGLNANTMGIIKGRYETEWAKDRLPAEQPVKRPHSIGAQHVDLSALEISGTYVGLYLSRLSDDTEVVTCDIYDIKLRRDASGEYDFIQRNNRYAKAVASGILRARDSHLFGYLDFNNATYPWQMYNLFVGCEIPLKALAGVYLDISGSGTREVFATKILFIEVDKRSKLADDTRQVLATSLPYLEFLRHDPVRPDRIHIVPDHTFTSRLPRIARATLASLKLTKD